MKAFGYHCTSIDPKFILADGFKATGKGFTDTNIVEDFYEKYLPKNPMFLSDLKAEVWSTSSKYCMKVDVTSLQLYPDFGHLIDFNAYVDEDCFYWEDKAIQTMLHSKNVHQQKLAKFILNELDDGVLWAKDFTGEMSRDLIGTFAIDGSLLTPERVAEVKSR